jgi:hypothetical protein
MSTKPRPTRKRRDGKIVPNEKATAFSGRSRRKDASHKTPQTPLSGALQLGNSDVVATANELFFADVESRQPALGRYTRVLKKLMLHFTCSKSTAERGIRDAELVRAADAEERRPQLRHRVTEQLHQIADREEERQPIAAVAALREIARISGLHAPQKLEVTHTTDGPLFDLRAVIGILDEAGLAAWDVLLEQIDRAERAGRLLPMGRETDGAVIDAEIVEPGEN